MWIGGSLPPILSTVIKLIIEEGLIHLPRLEYDLIGNWLFDKAAIANSVKTLGDFAFENLIGLKEIVWSVNLEATWERALAGCKSLGERFGPTNFLPPSCTYIGPRAFRDTQRLDTIVIPANTEVHPTRLQDLDFFTIQRRWRRSTSASRLDQVPSTR